MRICGVICEYNPFHRGHEKQLRQIRAALGGDTEGVCLLSGSFVPRGEPAGTMNLDLSPDPLTIVRPGRR